MSIEEQVNGVSGMSSSKRLRVLTNLREVRHSAKFNYRRAEERRASAVAAGLPAAEISRFEDDVVHRYEQVQRLEGFIAEVPVDIADSFRDLERAYGQDETPPIKQKLKEKEGVSPTPPPAAAPAPAAGGGGP